MAVRKESFSSQLPIECWKETHKRLTQNILSRGAGRIKFFLYNGDFVSMVESFLFSFWFWCPLFIQTY